MAASMRADLPRPRALVAALPVEIVPLALTTAAFGILEVARTHELTAYDAAYLDLAATRGLALARADDRLRAACVRAGVEVVG